MPNFVKVDSKPFHPDTYVGPEHEEDFLGGTHERDMGIKLRVENTVRWRWAKNKDDQDVSRHVSLPYYEDLNRVGIAPADKRAYYPMVRRLHEPPSGQRVF
jgi:hypothetical protein